MAKKIISLVVALVMVFSLAVCSVSASAFFSLGDVVCGAQDAFENSLTGRFLNAVFGGNDDAAVEDSADDAVVEDEDTTFKPFFDFYIDYDVVKTLNYGFEFGNVPEKEEPTVEEPTEAPTEEVTVDIVDEAPLDTETTTAAPAVEITEETPLADVEQIANTGDAGVATIVALSAVSAAAFVVAKKK